MLEQIHIAEEVAVPHPLGLSRSSQGLSPPFAAADDTQAWGRVPVRQIAARQG